MILKFVVPLVAVAGVAFAVRTVVLGYQQPVIPRPIAEPPKPPFEAYLSGSGLVEAASENVAISTPLPGLVTDVAAKVGARVQKGDLLFRLDNREVAAQMLVERAAVAAAEARIARLASLPRLEDVRIAEAKLVEANAALEEAARQLAMAESISDPRAMSKDALSRRRSDVEVATARVRSAQAALDWQMAGAWKPELEVARAELAQTQARVALVQTQLERLDVRAPLDATVLQLNLRAGEYATTGVLARPLVLLGRTDVLHVRVDIDENDSWRWNAAAAARAFVRGNRNMSAPLALVRVEPYVIPKRSLTGDSTERVDTRVLQALYSFDPTALRVYVGQQLDVYVEAPSLSHALAATPTASGDAASAAATR
jgi:multidrug efflux pump subunit AcrA (membrane-fusion protein)